MHNRVEVEEEEDKEHDRVTDEEGDDRVEVGDLMLSHEEDPRRSTNNGQTDDDISSNARKGLFLPYFLYMLD